MVVILNAPWILLSVLTPILLRSGIITLAWMGWIFPLMMVLAFIPGLVYWRGLDEPSREAHKFAMFWGAGMAFLLVGLTGFELMVVPGFREAAQEWIESFIAATDGRLGQEPAAVGLWVGVLGSVGVLLLGYVIAWIGWWVRQRVGTTAG